MMAYFNMAFAFVFFVAACAGIGVFVAFVARHAPGKESR